MIVVWGIVTWLCALPRVNTLGELEATPHPHGQLAHWPLSHTYCDGWPWLSGWQSALAVMTRHGAVVVVVVTRHGAMVTRHSHFPANTEIYTAPCDNLLRHEQCLLINSPASGLPPPSGDSSTHHRHLTVISVSHQTEASSFAGVSSLKDGRTTGSALGVTSARDVRHKQR